MVEDGAEAVDISDGVVTDVPPLTTDGQVLGDLFMRPDAENGVARMSSTVIPVRAAISVAVARRSFVTSTDRTRA